MSKYNVTWASEHDIDPRLRGALFSPQESLKLPAESHGTCVNVRRCKSWNVVLGDGLCMACYDVRTSSARGV